MLSVQPAVTADDLECVRGLFRAFVAWHRERHVSDRALIDEYFDAGAFERELATLPGAYVAPDGALLLARVRGEAVGCVALRRIDAHACEMKRMFVRLDQHGRGVGRALGEGVIAAARTLGYRRMLLDTSIRQAEAMGLYRRLGFREIEPYSDLPKALREWLVFMALDLA